MKESIVAFYTNASVRTTRYLFYACFAAIASVYIVVNRFLFSRPEQAVSFEVAGLLTVMVAGAPLIYQSLKRQTDSKHIDQLCLMAAVGEITAEENALLENHLRSCAICKEALAQYRRIALQTYPEGTAAHLFDNLTQASERLDGIYRYVEVELASTSAIIFAASRTKEKTGNKPPIHTQEVKVVSEIADLVAELGKNENLINEISPENFELLIRDRLNAMGLESKRVGHAADGGVDIVALPRNNAVPCLLAIQAKYHSQGTREAEPGHVKELQAVVKSAGFNLGYLVTNTSFTQDARWWPEQDHDGRLREMEDLRRWISNDFLDMKEWKEIPNETDSYALEKEQIISR